jgi:transcriptional regulator with XRE-family HTH domain
MRPSRSRLHQGYAGFRDDFGETIKERRKEAHLDQQTLADVIGIARPSLSAIENGRALPLPSTLDNLVHELNLDWADVLVKAETSRTARPVDDTAGADVRLNLGQNLRAGRRLAGLKLWELAKRCGLSKAQLSRIERGETKQSRVYEDHPANSGSPREERRQRFNHPELQRLSCTSTDK